MANEATLVFELGLPVAITVADDTGIEKGSVLKLADPYTASLSTADNDIVAGIAAQEKIASDGKTKLAVYRSGIFKMTASGSIAVGAAVVTASATGGSNQVATAAVDAENILGKALETVTTGETILVELNPFGINLA